MKITSQLGSFALSAGEPFLLHVQLRSAANAGTDIDDQALELSFYRPATGAIVARIEGVRDSDTVGEFFRFERDGRFSAELWGQLLRVELAKRLRDGRSLLFDSSLTVKRSAIGVPSLAGGAIGDVVHRINLREAAQLGGARTVSLSTLAYVAPASTPAPAPVFATSPIIQGTPSVGQTLTGMDGEITNGAVVSRRWLLAGTAVAVTQAYVALAEGSLTYEVTATGPGGTTTQPSEAVRVQPPVGPPATAKAGQIGFNTIVDGGQSFGSFLMLNRMKSGGYNGIWNNEAPLSAFGYPTAFGPGKTDTAAFVSLRTPTSGTIRHVLRHNGVGVVWGWYGVNNITIVDASDPNRVIFDVGPRIAGQGQPVLGISGAGTWPDYKPANPQATRDGIAIYELALEGDYLAGEQFHPVVAAAYASSFGTRWMDAMKVNNSAVRSLADRTPVGYCSYSENSRWGPPLEVVIDLHNKTRRALYINVPYLAPPEYVTWMLVTLRDRLSPTILLSIAYGNEVWNFGPGFNESFAYAEQVGHDIGPKDSGGNPLWGNAQGYGYLAAKLAKRVLDVFGAQAEARVVNVFERQIGNVYHATYAVDGVNAANTGLAFTELFRAVAIGFYLSFGIQDLNSLIQIGQSGGASPAQIAAGNAARAAAMIEVALYEATGSDAASRTVRSQLIQQARTGNGVPGWPNNNTLEQLGPSIQEYVDFCLTQGVRHLIGYEGQNPHSALDQFTEDEGSRINAMLDACRNDVRISGTQLGSLMRDEYGMMRGKGMTANHILTDFGQIGRGGLWASKLNAFAPDTRLWSFYQWYNDNAPDQARFEMAIAGGGLNLPVGQAVERRVTTFGGLIPASLPTLKSGALPSGMTLVAGKLAGTPTQVGSYPVVFAATDGGGREITLARTFTVAA